MIFSKIFSNKAPWQHKDSTVRISAIADFSLNDPQAEQILRDLAKKDDSELVRRSALLKLDTIADWQLALLHDKSASIKTQAEKELIKKLTQDKSLSKESKLAFISSEPQMTILEQWLHYETDNQLAIALVKTINKPQQWLTIYNKTSLCEVQRYFIEQSDDISQLQKFQKKALNGDISSYVNEKIAHLEELKQKPIRILKQAQLVLAKFLALKEQPEYIIVEEKQNELTSEWLNLTSEFDCLPAQEIETLFDKHKTISEQLQTIFAARKEQYEQEKIAQKLIEEKQSVSQLFSKQINQFAKAISTAVFENSNIDEQALKSQLADFSTQVKQSVLTDEDKQQFLNKANAQEHKLAKLPEIAESVATATQLISRISQVSPPKILAELHNRETTFKQWQEEFEHIEKIAQGSLPEGIVSAKDEITSQWLKAMRPLHKEQKQLFSQTQKKVFELKRLFSVGKFNAAFGVHKRFMAIYEQLSPNQQHRLQRDFDFISEKISELSDWEHYIATPRKQELLIEIKQLVEQPLDNPNAQAEKVKTYRKVWNSLGHADEDVDKAFNNEFNDLIEQAFAPCRMYYAEQESLREQHLVTRNQILTNVEALSETSTDIDIKQIDTELNKLQQQWRDAGEVDRDIYKKLNQRFLHLTKPLKAKIFNFHNENAKAKQNIIAKTMAIVDHENIFEAIDTLKTLQSQWKDIGFSGQKVENKLWAEFRSLNDTIFGKREQAKLNEQKIIDERIEQVEVQINAFTLELDSIIKAKNKQTEKHSLNDLLNAIDVLYHSQRDTKPVVKKLMNSIEALISRVKEQINAVSKRDNSEQWLTLFSVLTTIASEQISSSDLSSNIAFNELTPAWQKKIIDGLNATSDKTRAVKTLELEILASVESPSDVQSERMAVQVQLMQEKMTSGEQIDLQQNFYDWLASGVLTQSDISLIERIKPIFCK